MRSILTVTIGLSVLALVGAASAREDAPRTGCPKGYAPFGQICMSATSGDIVLPVAKNANASAQASAAQ